MPTRQPVVPAGHSCKPSAKRINGGSTDGEEDRWQARPGARLGNRSGRSGAKEHRTPPEAGNAGAGSGGIVMTKPSLSLPRYRDDCGRGTVDQHRSKKREQEPKGATEAGRAKPHDRFHVAVDGVLEVCERRELRGQLANVFSTKHRKKATQGQKQGTEPRKRDARRTCRDGGKPPRRPHGAQGHTATWRELEHQPPRTSTGAVRHRMWTNLTCNRTVAEFGPMDNQAATCAGVCQCICSDGQ